MTGKYLDDGSIDSAGEFEAVLAEAVGQAVESDIDVRGAWQLETRDLPHYWEAQFVELAQGHDGD